MTNARSLTISATAVLLLVAGGACADDSNDPEASGSPTPTSSTSATAPPTDSEAAAEAASGVVRKYFGVLDQLRQQPAKPLTVLSSVVTSSQLSAEKKLISSERDKDLRQVGDTEIAELRVQSVNLDNSDPSSGKVPTVAIDVCWDVGHADLVDESGTSVVSPSRPPTGWTRYAVANYHWSANPTDGWRIATSQDLKQTPCAAS